MSVRWVADFGEGGELYLDRSGLDRVVIVVGENGVVDNDVCFWILFNDDPNFKRPGQNNNKN